MSGDLCPGFGQYPTTVAAAAAAAATVPWNWTQMLANSTNSPAALQAAVAAQRGGYNHHQSYQQSVPTSAVPSAPWTQQWAPWAQAIPQQSRIPQHSSNSALPLQSPNNPFKYRLNGTAPIPANKTNGLIAPSSAAANQGSNGDNKNKEEPDYMWGYLEAQASFLGPSLWDSGDLKMEFMDLDEFLSENGIPIGEGCTKGPSPPRSVASSDGSSGSGLAAGSSSMNNGDSLDGSKPGSSASNNYPDSPITYHSHSPAINDDDSSNASDSSSILESITPTVIETPPVGRRKRTAVSICSSVNDNTSDDGSYVPGHDFDPKSRQFSPEELRPQPMSKKSKKQYVPDDMKDDKYWARRRKNNMAAKRSRDARRVKENQIAMRASFLEKEVNAVLKAELEKVTKLYAAALKRLEQYEKPGKK